MSILLTKNFTREEFDCNNGKPVPAHLMDNVKLLARNLQILRDFDMDGKPITINSGYRTPEYNRSVGGVDDSYHTKAMAADISVANTSPEEVYCAIEGLISDGWMRDGGLGYYGNSGHIHYDIGIPRRWTKPSSLSAPICPLEEEEEDEMTPEQLRRLEEVEAFNTGIVHYIAALSDMAETGKDFDAGIARYFGMLVEKQAQSFEQISAALDTHIRIHNQSGGPTDLESDAFLDELAALVEPMKNLAESIAKLFNSEGD